MEEEKLEKVSTKRVVLFTFFFIGYGVILAISSFILAMSGEGISLPWVLFQPIPMIFVEFLGQGPGAEQLAMCSLFFGGVFFWTVLGVLTAMSKRYKWLRYIVLLLLFIHYLSFIIGYITLLQDNSIDLDYELEGFSAFTQLDTFREPGILFSMFVFFILPFILYFFGQIVILIDMFWSSLAAKFKVLFSLAVSIIIVMLIVVVSSIYSIVQDEGKDSSGGQEEKVTEEFVDDTSTGSEQEEDSKEESVEDKQWSDDFDEEDNEKESIEMDKDF